jgi:ribosomal protein S18 acetylase RimI-like enzyme
MRGVVPHPLDDPVGTSLLGEHEHLARRSGRAVAYRPDVAAFASWMPGDAPAWDDLAALLGGGGRAIVVGKPAPPADWTVAWAGTVFQMIGEGVTGRHDPEFRALGAGDAPDMVELVRRTRPGPFELGTIELGGYLGLRDDAGRLIAMAGQRFRAPGFGEVSAVCTDPEHRRRGLGTRLVLAVAAALAQDGRTPFLHVSTENHGAIRVYERLGFAVRRELPVETVVAPG